MVTKLRNGRKRKDGDNYKTGYSTKGSSLGDFLLRPKSCVEIVVRSLPSVSDLEGHPRHRVLPKCEKGLTFLGDLNKVLYGNNYLEKIFSD